MGRKYRMKLAPPAPKDFQGRDARHDADLADVAEVTEHQGDQKAAAGDGEGEALVADASDDDAEDGGDGEGAEAEVVELDEVSVVFGMVIGVRHDLLAFDDHVGLQELRNELDEQDDADDAEQVRNTVADRDEVFMGGTDRLLGGGERRGGGEGTGQETGDEGLEGLVVLGGEPLADEDDGDRDEDGGQDDDESQTDVGLIVLLEIAEETGTGDEPDGRDEQDEADVLNDLERFLRERYIAHHQVRFQRRIEEAAVQQCGDEHTGGTEVDALDGDAPEQVARGGDEEDRKGQVRDRLDGQQSQSSSHG